MRKKKLYQLTKDQCDARGWGQGKRGITTNESGVTFWSDEDDLELGSFDVCKPRRYNKTHQIVHFKMVNFTVCELYQKFKKGKCDKKL